MARMTGGITDEISCAGSSDSEDQKPAAYKTSLEIGDPPSSRNASMKKQKNTLMSWLEDDSKDDKDPDYKASKKQIWKRAQAGSDDNAKQTSPPQKHNLISASAPPTSPHKASILANQLIEKMNTSKLYFVFPGPGKKKKTSVAQKQKSEPAQTENELLSDSEPIVAHKNKQETAQKQNVFDNVLDNELSSDLAFSNYAKQTSPPRKNKDLVDLYSLSPGVYDLEHKANNNTHQHILRGKQARLGDKQA
jgi:hypothetical protein